jgi:hypothetical protein
MGPTEVFCTRKFTFLPEAICRRIAFPANIDFVPLDMYWSFRRILISKFIDFLIPDQVSLASGSSLPMVAEHELFLRACNGSVLETEDVLCLFNAAFILPRAYKSNTSSFRVLEWVGDAVWKVYAQGSGLPNPGELISNSYLAERLTRCNVPELQQLLQFLLITAPVKLSKVHLSPCTCPAQSADLVEALIGVTHLCFKEKGVTSLITLLNLMPGVVCHRKCTEAMINLTLTVQVLAESSDLNIEKLHSRRGALWKARFTC